MAPAKPEFEKGDEVGFAYEIKDKRGRRVMSKRIGKVVEIRRGAVWEYKLEGKDVDKELCYRETDLVWE